MKDADSSGSSKRKGGNMGYPAVKKETDSPNAERDEGMPRFNGLSACVEAEALSLGYGRRVVLDNLSLKIHSQEFIGIIGPSGVGKSTLLMALNGTVQIFTGKLKVLGVDLVTVGTGLLKQLRARIGVIYQGFNLVKRSSVLDNVAAGMLREIVSFAAALKYYTKAQYERLYEYLTIVGLEEEALKRCDQLSGGQMQRVAIARTLAQHPEMILADEPISSLDPVSAQTVMDTLQHINRRYGITVIANLHQLDYGRKYCSRIIGINGGKIVYDGSPADLDGDLVDLIYQRDFLCSNGIVPPSELRTAVSRPAYGF